MDLSMPILALFLLLVAAVSHAAVSPQVLYWKNVLPNTPMPNAISQLLYPGVMEEKTTSTYVGKGGVHVHTSKGKPGSTDVDVTPGDGVGVNVHGKKHGGDTQVGVGGGGVTVHTEPKKKPVYVNAAPFNYLYAATDDQVNANRDVAVFFVEKDLHDGAKMKLHFTKTTSVTPTLLPRRLADAMPFSSKKLPEILAKFEIAPNSDDALKMSTTLKECEQSPVVGEKKACITSLESMVDYATASIGTRHVVAVSTTVEKENAPKQQYTIVNKVELKGENAKVAVACHAQQYVYTVFYCHATKTTKVYTVSMVAEDGSKVESVAVCHTDTSKWNPKHLAFQLLAVKPGTVPVCHFLPEDHVVWVPAK